MSLTSLNLTKNTKITNLSLGSLPNITSLDLSKNTSLELITFNSGLNKLKTLTMLSKNKSTDL